MARNYQNFAVNKTLVPKRIKDKESRNYGVEGQINASQSELYKEHGNSTCESIQVKNLDKFSHFLPLTK